MGIFTPENVRSYLAAFLRLIFFKRCQETWIGQNEDMRPQRASGKIPFFYDGGDRYL